MSATKPISTRVPTDDYVKLQKEAQKRKMSMSEYLFFRLFSSDTPVSSGTGDTAKLETENAKLREQLDIANRKAKTMTRIANSRSHRGSELGMLGDLLTSIQVSRNINGISDQELIAEASKMSRLLLSKYGERPEAISPNSWEILKTIE